MNPYNLEPPEWYSSKLAEHQTADLVHMNMQPFPVRKEGKRQSVPVGMPLFSTIKDEITDLFEKYPNMDVLLQPLGSRNEDQNGFYAARGK